MWRMTIGWRIFLVLEALALVASLTYGYFQTEMGPFLWAVQLVFLMPGSLLAGPLVENALWSTGIGLVSLGLLATAASIGINAVVWWAMLLVVAKVRHRAAL